MHPEPPPADIRRAHAAGQLTHHPRRRVDARIRLCILATFLALAGVATVQRGVLTQGHATYPIFRQSFVHLSEGRDLYARYPAEQGTEDRDRFKYNPTAALFFAPFAYTPFLLGLLAWTTLNALSLYAAVDRLLPGRAGTVALLIVLPALVGAVQSTSSNALIAALMVASFLAIEDGRAARAGAAIAAGTLMKLFPAAIMPFALTRSRRWRAVAIVSLVAIAFLAGPLLVTTPRLLLEQYRSWIAILSADGRDLTFARSIMVVIRQWTGIAIPNWPLQALATAIVVAPGVLRRAAWADAAYRRRYLASLLIYVVIFNHQSENASYIIAAVGLAVWFTASPATPARAILMLACVAGLEAVPYALVWLWLQYDLLDGARLVRWARERLPRSAAPLASRAAFGLMAAAIAMAALTPWPDAPGATGPALATAQADTAGEQPAGARATRAPHRVAARSRVRERSADVLARNGRGLPVRNATSTLAAAIPEATGPGATPADRPAVVLMGSTASAPPAPPVPPRQRVEAPAFTRCEVDTLGATFPASWLGTRVGRLTIETGGVELPSARLSSIARRLRVPTRTSVVEQELGFRTGDNASPGAIEESVRRLRKSSLFADVTLEGRHCDAAAQTDFTVRTRDAWTTRGSIQLGSHTIGHASFEDRNLLGTGRSLSVTTEETNTRQALAVGVADPYFLGAPVRASALMRAYAEGRGWYWNLRSREQSPLDPWRAALTSAQERRLASDPSTGKIIDITRRTNALVVNRRLASDGAGVWGVTAGIEQEQADLDVTKPGLAVAGDHAHRSFTAPLVGVSRRITRFRSIDWLVPGQRSSELPVGVEGEMVTGMGRDLRTGGTIAHWDGWAGVTAMPTPASVLTADVWSSGYRTRDTVSNASVRANATLVARAPGGLWTAAFSAERVWNPDPDVFALATSDPMLRTLRPSSRLAEQALSARVERSAALYAREGRWAIEGALFAAWSERVRTPEAAGRAERRVHATMVGIGLRQMSSNPWQAPLRLDIGRTVMRSSGLPDRWIISLSGAPSLARNHVRDWMRPAGR
ncbi:MAG: DUF2029 domain-containing protein [Gemmatimonadaceae bacterium]|nr:DUF2029 domain-containing protein [Gemmatimonadaceae bacterium]